MSSSNLFGIIFLWKGELGRSVYAFTGIALFLVKWNLDRLVSFFTYDPFPSPFPYLLPITDVQSEKELSNDALLMLAMALPFIYVGIVLTVKRLRSLQWPLFTCILFFLPFVNLLFFFLLCILPKPIASTQEKEEREKKPKYWLDRVIPKGMVACAVFSACLSAAFGALFVSLSLTTEIGQDYGWGVFVGLPFVMGLVSAVTYGHHARRKASQCQAVACLSLAFSFLFLLLLAIEGILCLAMAAPIALPLACLGGWVGYMIQNRSSFNPSLPLFLATFLLMGFEKKALPEAPLFSVRSEVFVNASPEKTWNNVVTFSELPPAEDWLFDLGIACPTCATIEGTGIGAVRHCNFTTGAFVEPITVWDEPNVLAFDVTAQPPPMKEISPYDIHPPHLDGHLESKRGEFRLERMEDGKTRLIGTTWYKHNMWPASYWKLWSDFLIGRIHRHVLKHVKKLSETD